MTTPDDIGDPDPRLTLVAEYALGLLDASSHARVGRMIEADPALRTELAFWQSRFSALDDNFVESAPPARVLSAIEARVFGVKEPSGWWHSLALWRSVAASAVAVAVAAIGFNLMTPAADVSTLTTQLVAALESEGSPVRFLALYDGSGTVRLTALAGEPGEGDFELWAIQGEQAPISMGVIPANQRYEVDVSPDVLAGWGEGSVLAITLEQRGGSPDGNPHGPVVAQGEVTAI
jgi:anti-sigma-K factor RskA